MERYQNFIIRVNQQQWQEFEREFHKAIDCGYWKERNDLAERARKNSIDETHQILCVETPEIEFRGKATKGVMWMWLKESEIEIFNIVPLIGNHLEFSEYNNLLEQFRRSVIVPMSANFGLTVEVSKPYFDIVDVATPESIDALKKFSALANKSTGNTHPCDFNRWCDFVISSFMSEKHISVSDLMDWLVENGWSDEMASKLSLEYEYSLGLLEQYEHSR